jgi:hypothetical protein
MRRTSSAQARLPLSGSFFFFFLFFFLLVHFHAYIAPLLGF